MTIAQLVSRAKSPQLAKILVLEKLNLNEKDYFFKKNEKISPSQYILISNLIKKLDRGFPVQYLCHRANFYGRSFKVNRNVLIPRPETETLVESCISHLISRTKKLTKANVIDIGTGSGNMIISLALELQNQISSTTENIAFYATDISNKALKVAKSNAKKHGVKINFLQSDLLSSKELPKRFDLVIANLPYLKSEYKQNLTQENQSIRFEPNLALDGGPDGLTIVRKLIDELPVRLKKNSLAIMEVGDDQKKAIKKLSLSYPKLKFKYRDDLTGRFRFVFVSHK